jgi:hypothetical protein
MLEQIELIVIVVMLFACYSAWKSNKRSDASWERMRRELTPTTYLGRAGHSKTFALTSEVAFDFTPGSVNYISDHGDMRTRI